MHETNGRYTGNELEPPFCSSEQLEQRLREGNLWTDLVGVAVQQAIVSHGDKKRDDGQTYLDEHIFPVAIGVLDYMQARHKPLKEQEVTVIAALLHDTVEDDPNFDLVKCETTYGHAVSMLVYSLTKFDMSPVPPGEERKKIEHDIYVKKIENATKNAQIVKLFDRINNLKCSISIAAVMPDKLGSYTLETEKDYLPIAGLLLDKELYSTLAQLIESAHIVLSQLEVQNEQRV